MIEMFRRVYDPKLGIWCFQHKGFIKASAVVVIEPYPDDSTFCWAWVTDNLGGLVNLSESEMRQAVRRTI